MHAESPQQSLVERARAGDGVAVSRLAAELRPCVEQQLRRYPLCEEDRRDLAQVSLMQILRHLESFRGDARFSTWLFRVIANEALMLMRSQRRYRHRVVPGLDLDELASLPLAADGASSNYDERIADEERYDLLHEALAELPQEDRALVVAHYHLDLGLHEIAARFSLTEPAVRSRLHRARRRLRVIIDEQSRPSVSDDARRGAGALEEGLEDARADD
jgi:RNA polymerase sigma-70 factor (ECF subfamily)